jgi:hypothetical protein
MVSCAETDWYRRYRRIAAVVGIAGGLAIIAGAALSRSIADIPLYVIGLVWVVGGGFYGAQGRRFVKEIVVTGATVQLVSAAGTTSLMASDVAEVRRSRFDQRQMGPITIRAATGQTWRAVPRFDRLFDVLVAVRQVNPALIVKGV